MPLFPTRPLRIQPYFGHRSASRLILSARALYGGEAAFSDAGGVAAIATMLGQFISHEAKDVPVTLRVEGKGGTLISHTETSDSEGFVRFDLPLSPEWDLPEHPAWEVAQLSWQGKDGSQTVDAHILAPGRVSRLAVISDIDDTIIETGITGGLKSVAANWNRVFAQMPSGRAIVPGADTFYGELGGTDTASASPADGEVCPKQQLTATRRPFFYVSSSPWNLFSYLVAFQRMRGLPLGPVKLRDWGLNRQTFGKASHGSHKEAAISDILAMYPDMQFAMIGDDTQGDLPAFAHAATRYPGRVAAVFLRTVSGEEFSPEEEQGIAALKEAGIPLWMGSDYATGLEFLSANGFTRGGETEQIVKVVDRVDEPASTDAAADADRSTGQSAD